MTTETVKVGIDLDPEEGYRLVKPDRHRSVRWHRIVELPQSEVDRYVACLNSYRVWQQELHELFVGAPQ